MSKIEARFHASQCMAITESKITVTTIVQEGRWKIHTPHRPVCDYCYSHIHFHNPKSIVNVQHIPFTIRHPTTTSNIQHPTSYNIIQHLIRKKRRRHDNANANTNNFNAQFAMRDNIQHPTSNIQPTQRITPASPSPSSIVPSSTPLLALAAGSAQHRCCMLHVLVNELSSVDCGLGRPVSFFIVIYICVCINLHLHLVLVLVHLWKFCQVLV